MKQLSYEMKKMLTALLLLCGFSTSAQEAKTHTGLGTSKVEAAAQNGNEDAIDPARRVVQEKPQPTINLRAFFAKTIRYPQAAKKAQVEGRVMVEFIVEKDGSLSDLRVVRGLELGHGLPEEAIRVVKSTPKWQPANNFGKPVRAYFLIPVDFKLP